MELVQAEWVSDSQCYLFFFHNPKDTQRNLTTVLTMLKDTLQSIFCNKIVLENLTAVLNGKSSFDSVSNLYKRVILVSFAARTCIGLTSGFTFTMHGLSPLESALELCSLLYSLFPSFKNEVYKLKFLTLCTVLTLHKNEDFSYNCKLLQKHGSSLKSDDKLFCSKIQNDKAKTTFDYEKHINNILDSLFLLNESLDKPFLIKAQDRLKSSNNNMFVSKPEQAKQLQEQISSFYKLLTDKELYPCSQNSISYTVKNSEENDMQNKNQHTLQCSSSSAPVDHGHADKIITGTSLRKPKTVTVSKPLKRSWTYQEDAYILKSINAKGHQWAEISHYYPFTEKRTGVQIKDRWRTMIKNNLVKEDSDGKIVIVDPHYKQYLPTEFLSDDIV